MNMHVSNLWTAILRLFRRTGGEKQSEQTRTVVTPAPEPVAAPASEPVAEVMPEPVAEVTPEPVAEGTPEPASEVTPEPVTEVATEPSAEVAPEPAAEVAPEPAAAPAPEPVTLPGESTPQAEPVTGDGEATPVQPPSPADFKDTPEKKALDELILATLREFQEKALAEGTKLSVTNYAQFFEKKKGLSIKTAIRQASAKCGLPPPALAAKVYLAFVPGVEVYDEGLLPFVCLAGTADHAKSEPRPEERRSSEEREPIPELKSLLYDIRKFASWEGADGKPQLEVAKGQLARYYPEAIADGEQREQDGIRLRDIFFEAYKAGRGGRPFAPIKEMLIAGGIRDRSAENTARKKYDNGVAAHKRYAEAQQLKRKIAKSNPSKPKGPASAVPAAAHASGVAQTSVLEAFDKVFNPVLETKETKPAKSPVLSLDNGNANILTSLAPSEEWTVLIDETGSDFSSAATGKTRGRMVALFVPKERPLADLPEKWHAVDQGQLEGPGGVLDLIQRIQTAKCGLMGLPITALPYTTRDDQWFSCLEDLFALSLRLLPLDGKTKLSLFVEQRGVASGQTGTAMLEKTITDVLHRLARVFPERAKNIAVEGKVIRKEEHPWNGYADAAAFTWGSPTIEFVLKETGWLESCIIDRDSAALLKRALDALRSEDVPDAKDWRKLLSLAAADNEASLVSALLNALGQEAKANVEVWKTFLAEIAGHLDSKAIDMSLLARQLAWLQKWAPSDAALPPRMRLLWLSAQLATANHSGRTDLHETEAFRKEFDELCTRLYREDCPLVAHANLHLAVACTNAFEFEKARDLLLPLREWPIEGMGLRMEGRLLSSLGQYEAFLGNRTGALSLFDEAIALFKDLSEDSFGEIIQTSAYAATASMDAKTPDADERLAAYLWGGPFSEERLVAEARSLAASSEPIKKYSHHILLRRLVELSSNHPARAAYLAEKSRWAEPAVGHPWELIEFYRALLLPAGPERAARLETARDIALADGGPTLTVIAAVIRGAAFCDGGVDREAYKNLVACCAESLPALGEARLAALRGQLDPATRLSPLDLAKAVLPFNFR